jgi:hypothetical protein
MNFGLFVRLNERTNAERLAAFVQIVKSWPEADVIAESRSVRAATLLEWQHGKGDIVPIATLKASPPEKYILSVDLQWPYTAPGTDSEVRVQYFPREIEAPLVLHHYRDTRSRALADECGDLTMGFGWTAVARFPASGINRLSQSAAQQDRLQRFRSFLSGLITSIGPTDVLLEGGIASDGAIASALVYHKHVKEFVRDLARALFLMEDYLAVFSVPEPWRFYPSRQWSYFQRELAAPENICTVSRLGQLFDRCTKAVEYLRTNTPQLLDVNVVHLPLLELCKAADALRTAITCATEELIVEAFMDAHSTYIEDIHDGWLLNHSDYGNGTLRGAYETLMQRILA